MKRFYRFDACCDAADAAHTFAGVASSLPLKPHLSCWLNATRQPPVFPDEGTAGQPNALHAGSQIRCVPDKTGFRPSHPATARHTHQTMRMLNETDIDQNGNVTSKTDMRGTRSYTATNSTI